MSDHRKMHKTGTKGIYRRGRRYVAVLYVGGRQKKVSGRTMAEVKKKRAAYVADDARGEFFEASKTTLREFGAEWVERYAGRDGTLRDSTRENYRRDLGRGAYRFFGDRKRLCDLRPKDIAQFAAWLCDPSEQDGRRLSDATVNNRFAPLRTMLGTAVQEGLIRHNPAASIKLPRQERVIEDDDEQQGSRALTREQLATILRIIHPKHRLLIEFLASTGLRIGEATGLAWKHLELETRPVVKVRRGLYRGRFGPPKTKHGRRDVPLPPDLAAQLRRARAESSYAGDDDPVFPNYRGKPQHPNVLAKQHLRPVLAEAGAEWATFHTFRHTFASRHIARGTNIVQLARLMGHHSPTMTLDQYAHLMDGDLGDPLDLGDVLTPDAPTPEAVLTDDASAPQTVAEPV
jgi:integrase